MTRSCTPSPRAALAAGGLLALLLAAALACSRPAAEPAAHVALRLVDLLPAADFEGETERIALGERQARRHLVSGWQDEQVEHIGGRSWMWSRGPASTLRVWLAAPRPLRAELRCLPHERFTEGLPMQVVANGEVVGTVRVAPGARAYAVDLPASALRAGENELTFRYLPDGPVRVHGRRAVAWESVRLRAAGAPVERAEAPAGEELRLPFHGGVSFVLEAPPRSRLALAGLVAEGGAAALRVAVEGEDGEAAEERVRPGRRCCATVPLAGETPRLVRLTLHAEGDDDAGTGLLRVLAPTVTTPQPPAAETVAAADPAAGPRAAAPAGAAQPTAPGAAPAGAPRTGSQAGARPPHLIVYLIDTLRADRLGVYGHTGGLTPNLDAFAREATLFEHATAQAPWTRPSVASIFTGLEPLDHGVWNLKTKLTDGAVTIAERLADAGYRTAGFSTNHHVTGVFGLSQGFQDFKFFDKDYDSRTVNQWVFRWLDGADAATPFFLYVHTIDPHQPFAPPADMRARFAADVPAGLIGDNPEVRAAEKATGAERAELMRQLFRLYDADVAHNDRSFGEFVAELRRRGLYDDAWVIVVADHGEEFDEHGALGHSQNLHAETVDVPLLVKPPRQTVGSRVGRVVQHIDLVPTLLRAAGQPVPAGLRGHDLMTAPPGEELAPRAVFSHLANKRFGMSVRRGEWKLIRSLEGPDEPSRLFRRRGVGDGAEHSDLAAQHSLRTAYLRSLLLLEIARPHEQHSGEARMDARTRDGLRALGYL